MAKLRKMYIVMTKLRTIITTVNKNQIYSRYPMFILLFFKQAFEGHCLQFYTINSIA